MKEQLTTFLTPTEEDIMAVAPAGTSFETIQAKARLLDDHRDVYFDLIERRGEQPELDSLEPGALRGEAPLSSLAKEFK